MTTYPRIALNPEQGGWACIRGLRGPVTPVVEMVSEGMTDAEIIEDYLDLKKEDIRGTLRYAAEAVREGELPLIK